MKFTGKKMKPQIAGMLYCMIHLEKGILMNRSDLMHLMPVINENFPL